MILPGVTPADPGDTGEADPALLAALAAAADGPVQEAAARTALLTARLLVPVVAVAVARDEVTGADTEAEMAVPALIGADGRRALPVFTSYDALRAWRPDARPVPMPAARVLAGAVGEGYDAVVVDVAGPGMHVLDGADLGSLAEAAARMVVGEAAAVVVVP